MTSLSTLSFEDIKNICTEFVNDTDTTIGMECNWTEWLIKDITFENKKEEIMQALNVSTTDYIVPLNVCHYRYGEMPVYIAIYDDGIIISTKERLLYELHGITY